MMSEQHIREQVWLWLPGQESSGATVMPGNLIVGPMFTLPCVSLHDHVTPSLHNLSFTLSLSFRLYWENRTSQNLLKVICHLSSPSWYPPLRLLAHSILHCLFNSPALLSACLLGAYSSSPPASLLLFISP